MQLRAITVDRARNSSFLCGVFPCSEDDNRRCVLGKLTGDITYLTTSIMILHTFIFDSFDF